MYRALLWWIDFPRDSSIDWHFHNAWTAGEGIINVEVNSIVQIIYHDNAIYIGNYYFYFIEGADVHVGLHWQLHGVRGVFKKRCNYKTSSGH